MNAKDPITGLTAKQEKFAQLVAAGLNYSDAYRKSYDVAPSTPGTTFWDHASELARHALVKPRIAELRAAAQKQSLAAQAWTLDRIVEAAEMHRQLALEGGFRGVSAANGALELIGRATGLLADKPTAPSTAIQIVFVTEAPAPRVVEGELIDEQGSRPLTL